MKRVRHKKQRMDTPSLLILLILAMSILAAPFHLASHACAPTCNGEGDGVKISAIPIEPPHEEIDGACVLCIGIAAARAIAPADVESVITAPDRTSLAALQRPPHHRWSSDTFERGPPAHTA